MRIVTPPAAAPVTLAQVKAQLRLDGSEEDDLLTGYIAAAVGYTQTLTSLLLMPQTIAFDFDSFMELERPLPRGPIRSVTVSYEDASGAPHVVDPATYRLREQNGVALVRLAPGARWPQLPEGGQVTVTADAGFADVAAVPATLHQAILFLAAHFYETRTPVSVGHGVHELPLTFRHLVEPHRLWLI